MYNSKYIEDFLTLVFAVTVCISIFAFASLNEIFKEILSSTIELNICAIISRIKKYMIKRQKNKHDEIAFLAKTNLDFLKDFISKSLTDSYIERDHFLLIEVLRKYHDIKEKINKLETS